MFQTLDTFDTEYSADSVEWCPAENYQDIFVCGTYQLTSESLTSGNQSVNQKRVGRIYLFQVIKDEKLLLKQLQQFDIAAVLDMKWAHIKCFNDKIILGVANANGFLQIYELIVNAIKIHLKLLSEILVDETNSSTLALSLDWSTGKKDQSTSTEVKITVSDSTGTISLFRLSQNGDGIERICNWIPHDMEAWITAFDYWNTNVIYSGADDTKFVRFDTRINSQTNTNRSHDAGVTSLHCNWKKEFHLVSGSYDETLRTWDLRNLKRPISETNLGGGIWRLKWDPYEAKYLLAACMYNGFFVIDCGDLERPDVIAEYKEHESIAYGCDWSHLSKQLDVKQEVLDEDNVTLVATCSFYDHVLKFSSLKFERLKTE